MQYHYVVYYDEKTDNWVVDSDTADVVLESVFHDEEHGEWVWDVTPELLQFYSEKEEELEQLLDQHLGEPQ